jgi:hypothetical protein
MQFAPTDLFPDSVSVTDILLIIVRMNSIFGTAAMRKAMVLQCATQLR